MIFDLFQLISHWPCHAADSIAIVKDRHSIQIILSAQEDEYTDPLLCLSNVEKYIELFQYAVLAFQPGRSLALKIATLPRPEKVLHILWVNGPYRVW